MISYRTASHADIPNLVELAKVIWHLHYPTIISVDQIDYMLSQQYNEEAIAKSMQQNDLWLIVEDEKCPVGFMACTQLSNSVCKLEKIYVHPNYQKLGIGRNAIQRAIEFTKSTGATELILNVNRKNTNSIQAYLTYGFRIIKEENNYIGQYLLDDYVMSLLI